MKTSDIQLVIRIHAFSLQVGATSRETQRNVFKELVRRKSGMYVLIGISLTIIS